VAVAAGNKENGVRFTFKGQKVDLTLFVPANLALFVIVGRSWVTVATLFGMVWLARALVLFRRKLTIFTTTKITV
jgi:hypothetical protein